MAEDDSAALGIFNQWLGRIEGRMDAKFDRLFEKLDKKADKAEVAELRQRIGAESERIDTIDAELKHATRSRSERSEWRRWWIPAMMTLAILAVGIVQAVK